MSFENSYAIWFHCLMRQRVINLTYLFSVFMLKIFKEVVQKLFLKVWNLGPRGTNTEKELILRQISHEYKEWLGRYKEPGVHSCTHLLVLLCIHNNLPIILNEWYFLFFITLLKHLIILNNSAGSFGVEYSAKRGAISLPSHPFKSGADYLQMVAFSLGN